MKKYIIILFLVACNLVNAQNKAVSFDNSLISYDGKLVVYEPPTWGELMAADYITTNRHYSTQFSDSVYNFLVNLFDTSSYYETTFEDSTTSGWFYVFLTKGNTITQPTIKSGDLLRWVIDDDVYLQDALPNHTIIGTESFVLVSSTDNWDNLTVFDMDNNSFYGYFPNIFMNDLTNLYMGDNDFTYLPYLNIPNLDYWYFRYNDISEAVEINSDSPSRIQMYGNGLIDSIVKPERWISTDLSQCYWNVNDLSKYNVDNLYDKLAVYYAENTPVRNLTVLIHGGTNDPPTCGEYNPDIIRLDGEIFPDAGYSSTGTITAGGTGSLQEQTYMSLPDTMYILVGEEFEIYDENVAGMNIKDKNLNIEYTCAIGEESYFGYVFDEVVGDVGFYDFKAVAKVCDTKHDSAECVIRLLEGGNGSGAKSFNFIGNSLMNSGAPYYITPLLSGLTGIAGTSYGTQGTSPKHEGRSGWSVEAFLTDVNSPMVVSENYDFSSYRSDTLGLGSPLDFIVIRLGINPLTRDSYDTAWIDTELIPQFEQFIDSMLADGAAHIIISMVPKGENTGDGWYDNYGDSRDQNFFLHKIQYLWDTICVGFSGKRYSDSVWINPEGIFIDRNNGYPKDADGYHDNGVHPNQSGYNQMSKSTRALIEGILKEESE